MSRQDFIRPSRPPDFEAEIYALRTDEGGRRTPIFTGYRPNHAFGRGDLLDGALHEYLDTDILHLGHVTRANLWLLCPDALEGHFFAGMRFTVQEGDKVVGYGTVTTILNPRLEKRT